MNQLIQTEIEQLQKTNQYIIENDDDLKKINATLRGVKSLKDKVCSELDPEIKKAHEAHKGLTQLRKKYLEPLEYVEKKINDALKQWTLKKEEEARLLQEKINLELAKKVEEEKKKLLESAKGDEWEEEVIKEKINNIKPVIVDLSECNKAISSKQDGQYKKSNWKARIIDVNKIPREFMIPDMDLLNKFAKEHKENFGIPGVEAYDDFTIVTKI